MALSKALLIHLTLGPSIGMLLVALVALGLFGVVELVDDKFFKI